MFILSEEISSFDDITTLDVDRSYKRHKYIHSISRIGAITKQYVTQNDTETNKHRKFLKDVKGFMSNK